MKYYVLKKLARRHKELNLAKDGGVSSKEEKKEYTYYIYMHASNNCLLRTRISSTKF